MLEPNGAFLFIGNDNDFLTSLGHIKGPDGTLVSYDGGSDDIEIVPDGQGRLIVRVRAERGGAGGGRVYTITATARDVVGNVAMRQATCTVPHDQGR